MEVRVMSRSAIRIAAILAATLVTLSACATANAPSPTPAASASASAAAVVPTHPVEFVISTAPGGGSDLYARQMATIIETKKFSPLPVTPLNKEGGSGAAAVPYAFKNAGDMYYI